MNVLMRLTIAVSKLVISSQVGYFHLEFFFKTLMDKKVKNLSLLFLKIRCLFNFFYIKIFMNIFSEAFNFLNVFAFNCTVFEVSFVLPHKNYCY